MFQGWGRGCQCKYSCTRSSYRHQMNVNFQPYTMAALTLGKAHSVRTEQRTGWTTVAYGIQWRQKILAPAIRRNVSLVPSARSHISIPTAYSRFSNKDKLKSTNTYLPATPSPACVKETYQEFWNVVGISKSSWGFCLYCHLPTDTAYSNSDYMR